MSAGSSGRSAPPFTAALEIQGQAASFRIPTLQSAEVRLPGRMAGVTAKFREPHAREHPTAAALCTPLLAVPSCSWLPVLVFHMKSQALEGFGLTAESPDTSAEIAFSQRLGSHTGVRSLHLLSSSGVVGLTDKLDACYLLCTVETPPLSLRRPNTGRMRNTQPGFSVISSGGACGKLSISLA